MRQRRSALPYGLSLPRSGDHYFLPHLCRLTGAGWVNAATGTPCVVTPTHWQLDIETLPSRRRGHVGQSSRAFALWRQNRRGIRKQLTHRMLPLSKRQTQKNLDARVNVWTWLLLNCEWSAKQKRRPGLRHGMVSAEVLKRKSEGARALRSFVAIRDHERRNEHAGQACGMFRLSYCALKATNG